MFDEEQTFGIRDRTVGGTTVVEIHGELDLLAAAAISTRLDALSSAHRPDLVLDLRPLTFIDCSGLNVLCRVHERVRERGGRLRLVSDGPKVVRLLRLTGLLRRFEVHGDLVTALTTAAADAQPADPGSAIA